MWLSLSNDMTSAMEHVVTSFVVALVIVGHFATNISACDVNCAGSCTKYGGNTCDSVCKANYGISGFTCKPCTWPAPGCNSPCNSYGLSYCDGPNCLAKYAYNSVAHQCQPCDVNCAGSCTVPGQCQSTCIAGYAINPTTHKCGLCDINCASACTTKGPTKCDTSCKTGYTLTAPAYTCIACDTNCAGTCATKGVGKCDATCKAGYSLNGTSFTCMLCDTNCQGGCVTKGATNCDATCKTNFVLTATFKCAACDEHCTNGCAVKKAPNCDGTCMTGWSWNAVTFKCVDINECNTTNGGCAAIPTATCANTVGSRTCACNTGYAGTGITCVACDTNCAVGCTAKGAGNCDGPCKSGYKWLSDFKCGLIVDGGWSDPPPTPDMSACTPGEPNGQITETKTCDNPLPANGGLECLKADNTRALTETTTLPCPCGINCAAAPDGCTTNGADRCDDGQCDATQSVYDSVSKTCVSTCDPECTTTSGCVGNGPGNCDGDCNAGFTFEPVDKKCHAPIDGNWSAEVVSQCTVFGQASLIRHRDCDNPPPQYGGANCTDAGGNSATTEDIPEPCPCDANCALSATCTGGYGTCDGPCIDGYGIDISNNTCQQCDSLCTGPCNTYGGGTCDGPCESGYGVHPTSHLCEPCGARCTGTCDVGSGRCDSDCAPGWAVRTTTHTCSACAAHCVPTQTAGCALNGPGRCDTACETGWVLDGEAWGGTFVCLACQTTCNITSGCVNNGPYKCDSECIAGYVLIGSLCQACDPKCEKVIGSCDIQKATKCDTTCIPPYVLSSTFTCGSCGSNCNLGCSTEGAGYCDPCSPAPCSSCSSGYGLKEISTPTGPKHACYPCAPNCVGGCDVERAGCCDGSCSVGTYTVYTASPLCHKCM